MISKILALVLCVSSVLDGGWRKPVRPPKPFALPHWEQGTTPTNGWSSINPSTDTIGIYVSSSIGDDSNNGLWPGPPGYRVGPGGTPDSYVVPDGAHNGPKRTIQAGRNALRNNSADWLLLKAGDTWNETFGPEWNLSGRSNTERIVITSYSNGLEDRPVLNVGTQIALNLYAGHTANNIAIVGLAIVNAPNNGGGQAMQFFGSMNNLLVEDCLLTQGLSEITFNVQPGQRSTNIVIRRNVITDTWPPNGGGFSAVFLAGVDNILIEENIFDRCGHRPGFPPPAGVVLPHTLYSQGGTPANNNYNTGLLLRGNVVARGDGFMDRSDIEIRNNLFLKVSIAATIGGTNHDQPTANPNGIVGIGIGNAFLDGYDFVDGNENTPSGAERGNAFIMTNVRSLELAYNIIANNVHGNAPVAFRFVHADDAGNSRGTDTGSIHDNIVYNWGGGHAPWWGNNSVAQGVAITGPVNGVPTVGSLTLTNNQFQYTIPILNIMRFDSNDSRGHITPSNNRYWCLQPNNSWCNENADESMQAWMTKPPQDSASLIQQMPFPNPNFTIGSYYQNIGAVHGVPADGTLESYLAALRLSQRKNWSPALMPTYANNNQGYVYTSGPASGPLVAVRQAFGLNVP